MSVSRLSDPQYKNWVEVGLATLITKKGLECYIQKAIDIFHTSRLNDTTLPNNTSAWKAYLTKVHRSPKKAKISWNNSDSSKWITPGESWEIAKIFMAPLGSRKVDVVNAQTTDLSGLLNVLEWAPRRTAGVFPVGVNLSRISDARKIRNLWAHAPSLQVADNERADAFVFLDSLLQDPELCHDKDVQNAVIELNKLSRSGLAVVEEKELEVVTQLQRALAQDFIILESGVTEWKEQVGMELEQIQDKLNSLLEFAKKYDDFSKAIDAIAEEMTHVKARVKKLEEQSQRDRSRLGEQSNLRFNPVCDRLREDFVGRSWLFDAVDTWLEKDLGPRESRVFCVWGGPGTGKSSWAREMVHRHEGGKLAGYHYCQNDNPDTCELLPLIQNLKSDLSRCFSDYAAMVKQRDDTRFTRNPEKMFDAVLTTPLQQLPERERHFLIIDGIDEGGTAIASCLAKLSFKLPSWLRVILTARHDAPVIANLFHNCSFESLDCVPSNQPAKQTKEYLDEDIHTFVKQKFENLQRERSDVPAFFATDKEGAIKEVVRASVHCFLYAKLVMEHIFDGHVKIELPASLSEIYCLDFRRLFPDADYFERKVAPILEIILALQHCEATATNDALNSNANRRPGEHGKMFVLFKYFLEERSTRLSGVPKSSVINRVMERGLLQSCRKRDVIKILKLLSGYVYDDRISGRYCFSHSSLGEWLQDEKSDFYCDVINGHRIMAQYCELTLKKEHQKFHDELAAEDSSGSSPSGSCSGDEYWEDDDEQPAPFNTCFKDDGYREDDDESPTRFATRFRDSFFDIFWGPGEARHLVRDYFYHSSYLPSYEQRCVQVLLDAGFEAIDLLHCVFWNDSLDSQYIAMKILSESDVLSKMSVGEKAMHFIWACTMKQEELMAKFLSGSPCRVIFNPEITLRVRTLLMAESYSGTFLTSFIQLIKKKGLLPHLLFSLLLDPLLYIPGNAEYLIESGAPANVCVPQFFRNTLQLGPSMCWNEDVQDYFNRLNSHKKTVITLDSLKEGSSDPSEAIVDDLTFEIIQKPLVEIEDLVKRGEYFISFTYAWHVVLRRMGFDILPKCGNYNFNARGYFGETGLMIATKNGDLRSVRSLLDVGVDVNQQDYGGSTALHFSTEKACNSIEIDAFFAITYMLLQKGADRNIRNCWGDSPTDIARASGNLFIQVVLQLKSKPSAEHACFT